MPQESVDTYVAKILSKYYYPNIAKRDVISAFYEYRSLRPKLSTYVFNDGSRQELACLDGTIPVMFKGKCYHIPVCIWLLDSHPYKSPLCYVKPTASMMLRPSPHVDPNGRVYLPYLHDWNSDSSDLLGVIQVMIIEFGEHPPVYTTLKLQNPSVYTTTPYQAEPSRGDSTATGGYPPYPPSGISSTTGDLPPTNSCPPTTTPYPPKTASNISNSGSGRGTITQEHINVSLNSAEEDKVKKQLREVLTQSQAEMEALKKMEDLNLGKLKLEVIISRLQSEQSNLEKNIHILRSKGTKVDDVLAKVKK